MLHLSLKAKRNRTLTYPSTAAMTSDERKDSDGESNHNGTSKKAKMEDDDWSIPTRGSNAAMAYGPDDKFRQGPVRPVILSHSNLHQQLLQGRVFHHRKNNQKALFGGLTGSDYKVYIRLSKREGAKEAIIQAAVWNKINDKFLGVPTRVFLKISEALIKH